MGLSGYPELHSETVSQKQNKQQQQKQRQQASHKIRLLSSSFALSSPQCRVFPYQPLNAHKNEHSPCISAPLDVNYRPFLPFLSGYLGVGSPLPPPTNGSRGGAEAEPRAFPRLLCCNYSCSQVYNLYYRFLVFPVSLVPVSLSWCLHSHPRVMGLPILQFFSHIQHKFLW